MLGSVSSVAAIQVSQSLDKNEIAYEDSARLEITIEWEGTQSAYRFERALDPFFDRLKVKAFSSSISSHPSEGIEKTTKTFIYLLVPTSSGTGKIDPITIKYLAMPDSLEGELVTEPMEIVIAERIPVETKGSNHYFWWFLTGAVVLGAGGFIVYWKKKASRPKVPRLSPAESFLEELERVKNESGSDLKKFQSGLHSALADFIGAAFELDFSSVSDEGVAEAFDGTNLNENQKQKIANWFVKARMDKFRPVTSPPGEVVRLENEIRSFFETLK